MTAATCPAANRIASNASVARCRAVLPITAAGRHIDMRPRLAIDSRGDGVFAIDETIPGRRIDIGVPSERPSAAGLETAAWRTGPVPVRRVLRDAVVRSMAPPPYRSAVKGDSRSPYERRDDGT